MPEYARGKRDGNTLNTGVFRAIRYHEITSADSHSRQLYKYYSILGALSSILHPALCISSLIAPRVKPIRKTSQFANKVVMLFLVLKRDDIAVMESMSKLKIAIIS